MKIDETDILILTIMARGGAMTTSEIAKHVFEIKDRRDLSRRDSIVRARLKRLCRYGVVMESQTKPRLYSVNPTRVVTGNGEVHIETKNGRAFKVELGAVVMIHVKNGGTYIIPTEKIDK